MAKSVFKAFTKNNDKNDNSLDALKEALRAEIMEDLRHEEVMDELKEKRKLLTQYGEKNKEYHDHVETTISIIKGAIEKLSEKDPSGFEYMNIRIDLMNAMVELVEASSVHGDMLKLFDGM